MSSRDRERTGTCDATGLGLPLLGFAAAAQAMIATAAVERLRGWVEELMSGPPAAPPPPADPTDRR